MTCGLPQQRSIWVFMAESVVEAVRSGQPLQIASREKSADACGVVVALQDSRLGVYTSWYAGTDTDGRSRETHVLLEVEVQKTKIETHLESVQWQNRSTSLKQRERTPVMLKWSQCMIVQFDEGVVIRWMTHDSIPSYIVSWAWPTIGVLPARKHATPSLPPAGVVRMNLWGRYGDDAHVHL